MRARWALRARRVRRWRSVRCPGGCWLRSMSSRPSVGSRRNGGSPATVATTARIPMRPEQVADVVRLTEFARCAGGASKMGPGDLARALAPLPAVEDPRLLVGRETFDDAAVIRITDDIALVQTVDFFAPIVDDPYTFGRVAAANALSDVFAMGGEPLTALNIVGFPVKKLPIEVLTEILRGGQAAVQEAGAVIVGGHTVEDEELKYGLSVTGRVDP